MPKATQSAMVAEDGRLVTVQQARLSTLEAVRRRQLDKASASIIFEAVSAEIQRRQGFPQ